MSLSKYMIAAAIAITATLGVYVTNFYLILERKVATSPDEWGQFGDYFGGVLNPLLSFIALILLIKSLSLQNETNSEIRNEIKNNEKTEQLRAFSILFFHIIDAQNKMFACARFASVAGCRDSTETGVEAVFALEAEIEALREKGGSDIDIANLVVEADHRDSIFGAVRSFYLAVKLATERLSDDKGFNLSDRVSHYTALINLTEFSHLRLILLGVQFLECAPAAYLKEHAEFNQVLASVKLNTNLY